MPTFADYQAHAPDEYARNILASQQREITGTNVVTCQCGTRGPFYLMYRCLYCGMWFCTPCMETHCGETVAEWRARKSAAVQPCNTILGQG